MASSPTRRPTVPLRVATAPRPEQALAPGAARRVAHRSAALPTSISSSASLGRRGRVGLHCMRRARGIAGRSATPGGRDFTAMMQSPRPRVQSNGGGNPEFGRCDSSGPDEFLTFLSTRARRFGRRAFSASLSGARHGFVPMRKDQLGHLTAVYYGARSSCSRRFLRRGHQAHCGQRIRCRPSPAAPIGD
jgi:hypothetical protein